jgi:hypothetical protein
MFLTPTHRQNSTALWQEHKAVLFTGRFISYPSTGCKKKVKVNYEHLY